jgi:hypothetical protein
MLLTIAILAQLVVQAPEKPASIEGTIVREGSNTPIEGALVEVKSASAPRQATVLFAQSYAGFSDRNGKFVVPGLPAGSYYVIVKREGYATQVYGARQPGLVALFESTRGGLPVTNILSATVRVIRLAAGEIRRDIVVGMSSTGVISGRILGRDGKPLVDASVKVLPDLRDGNGIRLASISDDEAVTDDRGEFRFPDAAPGRYFVVAAPPDRDDDSDIYAAHTYHPGVRDLDHATTVDVIEGKESRISNFTLQTPFKRRSVSGRLADNRSAPSPDDSFEVTLVPRHAGDFVDDSEDVHDATVIDDTFFMGNVPEGSYWLVATLSDFLDDFLIPGIVPIELRNADVQGVVLPITDPVSIHGRIRVDGKQATGGILGEQVRVGMEMMEPPNYETGELVARLSEVDANGGFLIDRLFANDFMPFAIDLPENMYVSAMHFGSIDVLNNPLPLRGPTTESLDIEISTRGGEVRGRIQDGRNRPAEDTELVLVPRSGLSRPDQYRFTFADSSGRYVIHGIPPGDYSLFAFKRRSISIFASDLAKHAAAERSLRITFGSTVTADLQVR